MAVKNASKPGRYGDGRGLMLVVSPSGTKSWILRIQANKRRRDFGLGPFPDISLAEARSRADIYRSAVRLDKDPVAERRLGNAIPSFAEAATSVHAEQKAAWKNGKHQAQWISTLERYAFPSIGSIPVDEVGMREVRDLLSAIWLAKPETARRVKQRIGTVIDYAVAKQWRDTELPMRAILKALPAQRKRVVHHRSMPYQALPDFYGALSGKSSMGRLALQFVILTACRSGEVRGARWDEVDISAKLWTVPEERMKAGRPHIVPLSQPAVDLLRAVKRLGYSYTELVFPGQKKGSMLSDMTLLKVMRDERLNFTVHGFRSTFRDWVADTSDYPAEVAEAALAHTIADKTVAAYKRTAFLEKRRVLMDVWGAFATAY